MHTQQWSRITNASVGRGPARGAYLQHLRSECALRECALSRALALFCTSQRSLHNTPIFRLLLKVAVNGTHQCDSFNFCGSFGPQQTSVTALLYKLCEQNHFLCTTSMIAPRCVRTLCALVVVALSFCGYTHRLARTTGSNTISWVGAHSSCMGHTFSAFWL